MLKLEIATQDFCDFINFCHLKGVLENKELLMKCSTDSISARALSSPSQAKDVCVNAKLLGNFADIGELGIDDLTLLKNFLNSLNAETITLRKTENKLICETKKHKFSTVLRGPSFIVNNVEEEKFLTHFKRVEDNFFVLKSEDLEEVGRQVRALGSEFIIFTSLGNKLNIHLGRINNELEISLDLEKNVEKFTVKLFANKFADIISCIGQHDLTFYMRDNCPSVIEFKNEKSSYQYLISPLVKDKK